MKADLARAAVLAAVLNAPSASAAAPPAPMVDGSCDEYRSLPSTRVRINDQAELYLYDDENYAWLCYTVPAPGMGQLDMELRTPALPKPMNLHVSAQLGEWPLGQDELIPKTADSPLWWRISGWTANTLRPRGMDTSGAQPRVRWASAPARELQLSKARFGHGEWRFALLIHDLRDASGTPHEVTFPADGSTNVWTVR